MSSLEPWNAWSNHQVEAKQEFAQDLSFPSQYVQWDFGMQESEKFTSFPLLDMFEYSDPLYASLDIVPAEENTTLMQDDLEYFFWKLDDEVMGGFRDFPFKYDEPPLLLSYDSSDSNNVTNGDMNGSGDQEEEDKKKRISSCRNVAKGQRSSNVLTKEEISKYFYMPITQAAKELNIGLTLLKKRCRELGIPRWPHRKLMSIQTLIRNVKELEKEEDGGEKLRQAVGMLEQEKKLLEKSPNLKLMENTKRLRQACFKANYKRRKNMMDTESASREMIVDGRDHFDQYSLPFADPVALPDQQATVARDGIEEDVKPWINIF
ncbi:hypothetical protein DCAR_0518930 [Daucus carota subsp. sativus]|uniref:RWP-RK domain-containing protein n=2 Tax=Daucus carota subsp. sativus TaxID=79200 RepID=A0AAF0X1G8_DAUCS|nr:hypothetical protein DCAR_0518930 [Daucus carota subsp. sativus]